MSTSKSIHETFTVTLENGELVLVDICVSCCLWKYVTGIELSIAGEILRLYKRLKAVVMLLLTKLYHFEAVFFFKMKLLT